jgi:hypothetical protein
MAVALRQHRAHQHIIPDLFNQKIGGFPVTAFLGGEDGAVIAVMRAAEAAALGDLEMADHWEAVAAMIDEPEATAPDALN